MQIRLSWNINKVKSSCEIINVMTANSDILDINYK
jgi:hypothetical protein